MIAERVPIFSEWLMAPIRRNRPVYIRVALAAVIINLFGLVTSLFSMTVYDRVVPNNATASLVGLSIGLALVVVLDFVLKLLRAYFVDIAGADIDREIGDSLFRRILALRLDQRDRPAGAIAGLMRELETLRDFFASATLTAIVDVPFILLSLLLIGVIGGKVVIVPMLLIPAVILVAWFTHPAMDRLSARALGDGLSKQSVLVETLGDLEMVKANNAGPLLLGRWRDAVERHARSSLRQRLIGTISMTFSGTAQTLSYAGIIIVGVGMVAHHDLTTGGLVACSILSSRVMAPLSQIASLLSRLTGARTAYRELDKMMTSETERSAEVGMRPAKLSGAVELRNVSFRYPKARDDVLKGINLSIAAGERVALLGRVGSGKSTVARLLLGLYHPQQGSVLIDGTEVRHYDPVALRQHIGTVLQDGALLTGSVRENITLGRGAIDDAELLRVCGVSGTHQFMGAIADGYDLKLADRGGGLSGGQRQSIAIARALAGSPAMLILDEPSSAMDQQTEAQFIERLLAEAGGRTMLVVTHRPALLRLVNRIVVLDAGRIAADGPRDKILHQLNQPRAA